MSKIDYELKSRVLSSTMYSDYKKVRFSKYNFIYGSSDSSHVMNYNIANQIGSFNSINYPKEWKECSRLYSAEKNKVCRLKKRLSSMLKNDCLFLTLTFTNDSLNRLSNIVRKKYVCSFLRSLDCRYIANIDFGKKNKREHYHAVIERGRIDYSLWHYGAINGQIIRNQTEDITRISKYVAKLTNHAIKETTQRSVIIYSKSNWEV